MFSILVKKFEFSLFFKLTHHIQSIFNKTDESDELSGEILTTTTTNSFVQQQQVIKLFSILQDKVYDLFKRRFSKLNVIRSTNKRIKNMNYIDSTVESVFEDIFSSLESTLFDFKRWYAEFIRELPGFSKLIKDDLNTIVSSSILIAFGLVAHKAIVNNECYLIINNNIQLSRNRMNMMFGTFLCDLVFEFHYSLKKLKLNEKENVLFHPFFLCFCNSKLISLKMPILFILIKYTFFKLTFK